MSRRASVTIVLGAPLVRTWAELAERWLGERRGELDELNVFPVADSDTGTNLYLTFVDAAAALRATSRETSAEETARLFARGALVGARGNSGVIVGQYVGALVRQLLGTEVTPARLVTALGTAADAAYSAVATPVEGTVLTVARSVAHGAREHALASGPPADALAVLEQGIDQGYLALDRTTGQLAALRAAGVLDAGAWGLLLVLDALAAAAGSIGAEARAHRRPSPVTPVPVAGAVTRTVAGAEADPDGGDTPAGLTGGGEFEVMFLVVAPGDLDVAPALRTGLSRIGESVAVVGGDGLWQAHVHTDHPIDATAVPASIGVNPSQIRVRHLVSQSGVHGSHRPTLGLVAVTGAPGLVADLARAGAVVVLVPPGASVGPELVRAVDDTGARQVLVLAAMPLAEGTPGRPAARVLDGLAEVQVVAGAATMASLSGSGAGAGAGGSDPAALLVEVTRSVARVRTAVVPAGTEEVGRAPSVPDVGTGRQADAVLLAARALLRDDAVLLTVLSSASTSAATVGHVRTALAISHPHVEVLELGTDRPGAGVELGVE